MFFALEMTNMRNSSGEPTWAIYGVFKAIFDMIEQTNPSAIAVAFDLPEPSFRHVTFDDYKANRPDEMPDDLKAQWDLIKDAFRYLHIPVLEEPGFEADDLIGMMAKKAEKAGSKVLVLSGDRDLFQLVNEQTTLAIPQRGGGLKMYSPPDVFDHMGVWPNQITDYKGIAGDSSDNIPGVKGLGPKAATRLLGEYGHLENIYENIEAITPPGAKQKLIDQEENARLSKYLGTLFYDEKALKDTDLNLKACDLSLPELDPLIGFFKHLEFNSILKRLPIVLKPFNDGQLVKVDVGDLPEQEFVRNGSKSKKKSSKSSSSNDNDAPPGVWQQLHENPPTKVELKPFIVLDESSLNSLVKKLEAVDSYAFDLETTGLNTLNCEIVGWSFAFKEKPGKKSKIQTFYIPILHQNVLQLPAEIVLEKLKPILEDKKKLQIIQNAKYELKILKRLGVNLHDNFYDTMLASYVNNSANKHGLKAQATRVFNEKMTEIDEIIGTGKKQITMDQAPIDEVAPYAAADAYETYKLYEYYSENLIDSGKKVLDEIELPLVRVLADIEDNGVTIDEKYFAKLSAEITEKVADLQKDIWKEAGEEFNIASPKQLSSILFEKLEISPVGKKTKTGAYSTGSEVLETLLEDESLTKKQTQMVANIIEFRTSTKLLSTYVDNLPKLVAKETKRLHSDFNQVVTATGRLSSSNPNLQNIPIRTEQGRQVRKGFVAKNKDHVLISADYSQIELRLLAHMANEKALIDAFKKGQDIHKRTAMEMLDKSEEEITDDDRRLGKTLNFALIYMQGPFATAKQLGISMKEAKAFINQYFEAFPKVKPFMDQVLEDAHEEGYTETMFGRRRYFRNLNSSNRILQKEEERQAFNSPLQGTAADIMKYAMINVDKALRKSKLKTKVILQVHDELVFEVPKDEVDEVTSLIQEEMEFAKAKKKNLGLKTPLLVDISAGSNWLEAK